MTMASSGGDVDTRGPIVLAVTASMIVCSTIFVVFRLISRGGIVRRIGWDDYFIILAWLLAFGLSFAICFGTSVGLGRHQDEVEPRWYSPLKKSEYAFSVLYNPALMATKTSICIFYLSLSKSQKVFRWCTLATLAVVNIAGIALTFLNVVQCRPVGAVFQTPVPNEAHCTDIVSIYLSSAPVNIITDVALLFLPMPILTGMRLPRKQKIILIITFSFGVFAAVVDVVRTAYLQAAARTRFEDATTDPNNTSDSRNMSDLTWYFSLSFMWSAIEVNVGIMCACVPALKPLVSRFLPHWIRDSTDPETLLSQHSSTKPEELTVEQRIPSLPTLQIARPAPVRTDSPPSPRTQSPEGPMGMMEFLTTPEMNYNETSSCERSNTVITMATAGSHPQDNPTFFDFVNIKRRKSTVQMSNHESLFPVFMVTLLFFLWGFAYGLMDTLNAQFQIVANMSMGQSMGIHCAYFGAYFIGPLTFGRYILKTWGFKACYIVGLCVYACGTLVFWPSAVLTSFPAFLISNFIVGLGLSTLEVAANPFIALCGPPEYAELRLNLSQGLQAIGTICSPLLAKKALFGSRTDGRSLIDVQWTYLGIALFTLFCALGYYYVPLPEATDQELEDASERIDDANTAEICGVRVIWITLGLAIFAEFAYVGCQESVSTAFSEYIAIVAPNLDATSHQAIGHTAFAIGRFVGAFLNLYMKPRRILLWTTAGAILFAALCMNFTGAPAAANIILLYFFEAPIFSIIFAQALRGLGRHTKDGSALLTAAISGGAVFPPITHVVGKAHSVQYSFCVCVATLSGCGAYALYVNFVPKAKKQIDPVKYHGLDQPPPRPLQPRVEKLGTSVRRFSRVKELLDKRKDSGTTVKDFGYPLPDHHQQQLRQLQQQQQEQLRQERQQQEQRQLEKQKLQAQEEKQP